MMSVLSSLEASEPLLIICDDEKNNEYNEVVKKFSVVKFSSVKSLKTIEKDAVRNIIVETEPSTLSASVLLELLAILKAEGQLIITHISDVQNTEFNLKTNGFINVEVNGTVIKARKPKFAVGSSAKLNLKKPTVWKLEDDDNDELIDQDDLLDEDDLKKPDPSTLRVCGTTGVRKACKDCSCGLADELAAEAQGGNVVDTKNAPKSSCGNCYLGDAFRCASCPYLGMPAFKPGEKIQLSTTLLKSDI